MKWVFGNSSGKGKLVGFALLLRVCAVWLLFCSAETNGQIGNDKRRSKSKGKRKRKLFAGVRAINIELK